MAITPKFDAIPAWALANLVASTAEFQRATGTTSEAAALPYIYYLEVDDRREGDDEKRQPRPRCIIEHDARVRRKQATGLFNESGVMAVSFEVLSENLDLRDISGTPTFQDLSIAFMNFYGLVLNQMGVNIDTDPNRYLNVQEMTLLEGPVQVREREEDFWGVCFGMPWFG